MRTRSPNKLLQEADDLPLGAVVGLVTRHEITKEIVAEISPGLADDGEQSARHVEKLGHRGDVQKLRVDRNERAGAAQIALSVRNPS